jgi:hypothetical protein
LRGFLIVLFAKYYIDKEVSEEGVGGHVAHEKYAYKIFCFKTPKKRPLERAEGR